MNLCRWLRVNILKRTTDCLIASLSIALVRPIPWIPAIMIIGISIIMHAFLWPEPANAQTKGMTVLVTEVTSEFPEGIRFKIEIQSENHIDNIAVNFRKGQETRGVYEYLDFEETDPIKAELFWRTNTSARYIPPGTIITYNFEIGDSEGNRHSTPKSEFVYYDSRFDWEEIEEGLVAVAYHGPVVTRAKIILDSITETLNNMASVLGADTSTPIRVTMYNNVKEMLIALPPGSTTIRRELITEGQAFTSVGTLLVLGGGRGSKGTASHEVTHILNHRAGDSVIGKVPAWLDEGLAEFGNISPGFSYDIALEFALANDRLLPITSMPTLPGDPEDVIIFYGQARSIVKFMVAAYGPEQMRKLMATMKAGANVEDAIFEVYGITRIMLENQWRETIGAPEYLPAERGKVLPTPIPRRELQLFTLTPQAGAESVESLPNPTSDKVDLLPFSTSTPGAEVKVDRKLGSTTDQALMDEETTRQDIQKPDGLKEDFATSSEKQSATSVSTTCNAAGVADTGIYDLTTPMLMIGLIGLGLRRRR